MLSPQHRLRSTAKFGETIRKGRRKGSSTVVVHVFIPSQVLAEPHKQSQTNRQRPIENVSRETSVPEARYGTSSSPSAMEITTPSGNPATITFGGPRVGLVVSKAVGNAVTRHRVSRLLRAAAAQVIRDTEIPSDAQIVLRALPAIANKTYEQIYLDVRKSIQRVLNAS